MRFGPVPINDALSSVLAHSISAGGTRLRKGTVLSGEHLALLRAANIQEVVVARLDATDVGEDEAALQLAHAIAGANLRIGNASTGRCNIYARQAGLVTFDQDAVHALNMVDEAITLATLLPGSRVTEGQMVATVKIIPFAVPKATLGAVIAKAHTVKLSLAPFKPLLVALIQTRLPGQKPELFSKTERVTEARLARLGLKLASTTLVDHETEALAGALHAGRADLTLVVGASAITDREDVIPGAIVQAGGRIERLGMPVDPGNLLCLGEMDGKPIIGLPGCARSPKLNGFDWILERIVAGLPVDSSIIARMGVGGLIDEIPERPMPRRSTDTAMHDTTDAHQAGTVGAIVLAAGLGRRMGNTNKLLIEVGGKPIIRHVIETLSRAGVTTPIVVTGKDADRVRAALAGTDVHFADNPDYESGLSTSIRTGIRAVPPQWSGALICLGDMPEVKQETIQALVAAFDPTHGKSVCVPVQGGKRGNPVLWGRTHFPRLTALSGDVGGKALLAELKDETVDVPVPSAAIHEDVDTPAAAEALIARWSPA